MKHEITILDDDDYDLDDDIEPEYDFGELRRQARLQTGSFQNFYKTTSIR